MSGTSPGSASEDTAKPAARGQGLHVAAVALALPEYHRSMTSPFALMTNWGQRCGLSLCCQEVAWS
jgi:hypothetical protein